MSRKTLTAAAEVCGACQEVAHLGDVAQDFGSQAPDGVLEMLDALGDELGLRGGKPSDLIFEAADVAGQALGESHRDCLDACLQGCIAEERAEDIRASALPRPSPHIRDALPAAQVGVGQISAALAAGVERVGPDALRQLRQGRDGQRLRGCGLAFEGHDPGDAAAEQGSLQREDHQRAGRDARKAAAEIDGRAQPAAEPEDQGGQGVQQAFSGPQPAGDPRWINF